MAANELNVTLTGDALVTLQHIAQQRGVSIGDALARAISNERWLTDEVAAGNRIYAENDRDRERRQLNVDDVFHAGV